MSPTGNPDITPLASNARVSGGHLVVALADGRELTVPTAWFTWLERAAADQRADLEIVEDGRGIWWPNLDEGLSVAGLLGFTEGD